MVNIKEYTTGDFLTASTIKSWQTPTAVITDEGALDSGTFDHEVFRITVEKHGQKFTYTMNATSARKFAETWSEETTKWVGKVIEFDIVKMNVKGTLKDVIYSHPAPQPQQTA
mgnify:CR=1 FL=1